jgi:hypothetical protein
VEVYIRICVSVTFVCGVPSEWGTLRPSGVVAVAKVVAFLLDLAGCPNQCTATVGDAGAGTGDLLLGVRATGLLPPNTMYTGVELMDKRARFAAALPNQLDDDVLPPQGWREHVIFRQGEYPAVRGCGGQRLRGALWIAVGVRGTSQRAAEAVAGQRLRGGDVDSCGRLWHITACCRGCGGQRLRGVLWIAVGVCGTPQRAAEAVAGQRLRGALWIAVGVCGTSQRAAEAVAGIG